MPRTRDPLNRNQRLGQRSEKESDEATCAKIETLRTGNWLSATEWSQLQVCLLSSKSLIAFKEWLDAAEESHLHLLRSQLSRETASSWIPPRAIRTLAFADSRDVERNLLLAAHRRVVYLHAASPRVVATINSGSPTCYTEACSSVRSLLLNGHDIAADATRTPLLQACSKLVSLHVGVPPPSPTVFLTSSPTIGRDFFQWNRQHPFQLSLPDTPSNTRAAPARARCVLAELAVGRLHRVNAKVVEGPATLFRSTGRKLDASSPSSSSLSLKSCASPSLASAPSSSSCSTPAAKTEQLGGNCATLFALFDEERTAARNSTWWHSMSELEEGESVSRLATLEATLRAKGLKAGESLARELRSLSELRILTLKAVGFWPLAMTRGFIEAWPAALGLRMLAFQGFEAWTAMSTALRCAPQLELLCIERLTGPSTAPTLPGQVSSEEQREWAPDLARAWLEHKNITRLQVVRHDARTLESLAAFLEALCTQCDVDPSLLPSRLQRFQMPGLLQVPASCDAHQATEVYALHHLLTAASEFVARCPNVLCCDLPCVLEVGPPGDHEPLGIPESPSSPIAGKVIQVASADGSASVVTMPSAHASRVTAPFLASVFAPANKATHAVANWLAELSDSDADATVPALASAVFEQTAANSAAAAHEYALEKQKRPQEEEEEDTLPLAWRAVKELRVQSLDLRARVVAHVQQRRSWIVLALAIASRRADCSTGAVLHASIDRLVPAIFKLAGCKSRLGVTWVEGKSFAVGRTWEPDGALVSALHRSLYGRAMLARDTEPDVRDTEPDVQNNSRKRKR